MEEPHGTLFVSIPSVLDPSLCPPGTHIVHMFTPDWMDAWQVCPLSWHSEGPGICKRVTKHCTVCKLGQHVLYASIRVPNLLAAAPALQN